MSFTDLFPGGVTPWQVVFAILSVLTGWLVSRFARSGVRKLAVKTPGISDSVAQLAARLTQYVILLGGIGIGLAFLGANVQPLLAMTAVAVVVLILVLRGVADNFAAGVLLQSRRPIQIGEQLTIGVLDEPVEGIVRELNGRSVVVETSDGRTIHVPNATLLSEVLVNDSRYGARRSEVVVRARLSDEIQLQSISDLIVEATRSAAGVHTREPPTATIVYASTTRSIIEVRFWHHPLQANAVSSDVVRRISQILAESGITYAVTGQSATKPLPAPEEI
ncbi:mechanosensitive ion channel [Microbacterium foliorum]|uniref:Mechanosensitive ion channel n=1 Tax=Microbacterium foliorum TaxID=104336 RepID=A0A4Y5YQ36_9MICO|nr:mechanosensitive ion channel domain-containing protein [Microbacterium foliorum]QDE34817.1 mechanosensitive ion channel [Microbacterium foliorum]